MSGQGERSLGFLLWVGASPRPAPGGFLSPSRPEVWDGDGRAQLPDSPASLDPGLSRWRERCPDRTTDSSRKNRAFWSAWLKLKLQTCWILILWLQVISLGLIPRLSMGVTKGPKQAGLGCRWDGPGDVTRRQGPDGPVSTQLAQLKPAPTWLPFQAVPLSPKAPAVPVPEESSVINLPGEESPKFTW